MGGGSLLFYLLYFKLSADQGNADGQLHYALSLEEGAGVAKNLARPRGATNCRQIKEMLKSKVCMRVAWNLAQVFQRIQWRPRDTSNCRQIKDILKVNGGTHVP
jgi:hypothetical protein